MVGKILTIVLILLGMQFSAQTAAQNSVSATTCMSCHGAQGLPSDPTIPVIQGQHFYYLYVQLKDYNSGLRANPIMSAMVAGLSRDDMKALSPNVFRGSMAKYRLRCIGRPDIGR